MLKTNNYEAINQINNIFFFNNFFIVGLVFGGGNGRAANETLWQTHLKRALCILKYRIKCLAS